MGVKMRLAVVVSCYVVVLAAGVEARGNAAFVMDLITTKFFPSPVYKLPAWESPLTIFGVRASSDVHFTLLHPSSGTNVTISIQVTGFSGQTQLTHRWRGSEGGETVVSRDKVFLNAKYFTWFSVFRKDNFISLFVEEEVRLLLAYTHEMGNQLNFLDFTDFTVQSLNESVWDFLGDEYSRLGEGPGHVEVVQEVQATAKGLIHRLLILEYLLDAKPLDRMPQVTKRTFLTHLRRTEAFILLCRFYGFDFVKHVKFFPWNKVKAALKEAHKK